jgi:hypothetical protein
MPTLPGVKVGPLDPDVTESFGQVAAAKSAKQLIRYHIAQNPPALRKALAALRDDDRSKAALDNLEEIQEYVERLTLENGDPVMPAGSVVNGAAVRGNQSTGRMLTFTFKVPSGRVSTWFAPYNRTVLPVTFDAGETYSKVRVQRDRGVVALDTSAMDNEMLTRHNRELLAENDRLRKATDTAPAADAPTNEDGSPIDTRGTSTIVDENEQLRRQNVEIMAELQSYRSLAGAAGGGVPMGGLDERTDPNAGVMTAGQDPPFEGYDDMNAVTLATWLKSDERTDAERQAVLDFEVAHSNRRTVVAAAEGSLGSGS